jgi:NADP-dependent 3-hydroxy acid dehydrogenase YdfG
LNALAGRKALITGATSGIGAATARALARAGADVALTGRRNDRLQHLREEITAARGSTAYAFELDVTDEAAVSDVVADAADALGGLNLLVNNAGVMLIGGFENGDSDEWRTMTDTNILGTMFTTRAALPFLKQADPVADIVNISSVAGRIAYPGSVGYNASKFAVNGFTESLRQELTGTRVRVGVVEPGMVRTELIDHITDPAGRAQADAYYGSMPILEADDVAGAVLYITSQPAYAAVAEVLLRPAGQQAP